jgi:predicted amidohydrolase YtcJ
LTRFGVSAATQRPKHELEDFKRWTGSTKLDQGDSTLRLNGAGEMLVFSAADFEDFLEPRPNLNGALEIELEAVIRHLAAARWSFRLHATYDESIERFLNVFEKVNRDIPFKGFHWFFDHAETISDRNIERVVALGGGIAVQHRMAFQGEYFVNRYGADAARKTPPVRRMLELGCPVGAGTDATRVASFNPFVCLYWLVTGKTVGGLELYPEKHRLMREEALRLYTQGSSWFSAEDGAKGELREDQMADFAVLTNDYFKIPAEQIKNLESQLTVVGGEVVHASHDFQSLAPPPLPAALDWAPTAHYGGDRQVDGATTGPLVHHCKRHSQDMPDRHKLGEAIWGVGCDCFAF